LIKNLKNAKKNIEKFSRVRTRDVQRSSRSSCLLDHTW